MNVTICKNCGEKNYWPQELDSIALKCPCGEIIKLAIVKNAWVVLHARYSNAVASGEWDSTAEYHWLFTEFSRMVPNDCGCQATAELEKIDLTTAATAEFSAFELHNFVSVNRVSPPKPEISWADYLQLYPR